MKTYQSHPTQTDSSQSESFDALPFAAKIADPVRTLLVVDDDPMIRELATQTLRNHGYQVLQAETAADALRLADQAVAIDLLITDFAMPEMDGLELTRRFRAEHPKTPVLMVSGSGPLIQHKAEALDRFEFLAKPFHLNELITKVRALLEAASPLPLRRPWCCD